MWEKLKFNFRLAVPSLWILYRSDIGTTFASTAHFQQYIILSGEGGLGSHNTAAGNSGTEGRRKKGQSSLTGLTETNL